MIRSVQNGRYTNCSVRIPPEHSGKRYAVMIAKRSEISVLNKIIVQCFGLKCFKFPVILIVVQVRVISCDHVIMREFEFNR